MKGIEKLIFLGSLIFTRCVDEAGWWRFGTPGRFHLHRSSETIKMETTTSSEKSSVNLIHTVCEKPRTKKYYSDHGETLKTRLIQKYSRKYPVRVHPLYLLICGNFRGEFTYFLQAMTTAISFRLTICVVLLLVFLLGSISPLQLIQSI
jgi:hypothetical protein